MHIRLIKISTTAYEEEDFYLMTTLSDEQIEKVITPIVDAERNGDENYDFYDNDSLMWALKEAYPNDEVGMYTDSSIDTLKI
jgi:hypothetical protein